MWKRWRLWVSQGLLVAGAGALIYAQRCQRRFLEAAASEEAASLMLSVRKAVQMTETERVRGVEEAAVQAVELVSATKATQSESRLMLRMLLWLWRAHAVKKAR